MKLSQVNSTKTETVQAAKPKIVIPPDTRPTPSQTPDIQTDILLAILALTKAVETLTERLSK